jgi:N-methylhydantoinase B
VEGGGGYGDPLDRDPKRVIEDVLDEYVSAKAARDLYGVIVDGQGGWEPTEARRDAHDATTSETAADDAGPSS